MRAIRVWSTDHWARMRIPVATFLIAVSVALVTALLALVVEDALPLSGQCHRSPERIGCLLASLAVLWFSVYYRNRILRRNGTVFYARVVADLDSSAV
ncbi:MAG: hypothetical protein JXA67_10935 [Micromonosporaceae bacterium]|nr:hypothetical protein [Micromonosporaceae bacterium]